MKKILVTGFEPFNGQSLNASYESIKYLPASIEGALIYTAELPTVFHECFVEIKKHIDDIQPDIIIMTGEASQRNHITFERVAINIDDATIKDNKGHQPIDETIIKMGTSAYFSLLPLKKIMHQISLKKHEVHISNSAGTFVCNHLMYQVLHLIKHSIIYQHTIAGFVHVPLIFEQTQHEKSPTKEDLKHVILDMLKIIIK